MNVKSSLCGAAGCVLRFLGRILVGSFSARSRMGNATSLIFVNFSKIWECNFAWQAQYVVRLEVDVCCSAHCK